MLINALNSGARVFMADIEDALSPTWANVLGAQTTVLDAVNRKVDFTSPEGKRYALNDETATLVVRHRGWHLTQAHVTVDGEPVSASLFDFGLHLANAGRAALERGAGPCLGPYYYLPKLESHLEARLWNDAFVFGQEALGIPVGTIRATVLIETIWAAFEMEEILHELRDHAAGLNAGRWDYIFSLIKAYRERPDMVLPDRGQVTMAVPFMRAYTQSLVRACHRRGAHAIGGMSAFIPNRREPEVTAMALERVREDKEREAGDGFDGTWVAHPDLVPVAREIFDAALGERPNQKDRLREDALATRCGADRPERARRRHHRGRASGSTSAWRCSTSTTGCAATARRPSTTSWRTSPRPRSAAPSSGSGGSTARACPTARWSTWLSCTGSWPRSWPRSVGRDVGRMGTAAELLYGLVMSATSPTS